MNGPGLVETQPATAGEAEHEVSQTFGVAGWTLVSRVSGLARVIVAGATLGPTFFANILQATNTVPNLTYNLHAGSWLTTLMVPTLVHALEDEGLERGKQLARRLFGVVIAGFCAAGLAFGRVASVIGSVEAVLAAMGPSPAAFVRGFDPTGGHPALRRLRHRWIGGDDLVALVWILRRLVEQAGSIEGFFLRGYRDDADDVGPALDAFGAAARAIEVGPAYRRGARRRVGYFFPRPADGSACKRLNLFLRWMVRRDRIDFGVWTRVDPAKLVVPLDTHVVRLGHCVRLTRYRSPGWAMAREITGAERRHDAADPVRYDFSLCHVGMADECGFTRPQRDERCPLRGVCRPRPGRPRSSRRPSGRR